MRTLVVTPYLPSFPGSGSCIRTYCLARELSGQHELRVLATSRLGGAPPGALTDLESFCQEVRVLEPPAAPSARRGRVARLASWVWSGAPLEVVALEPLRGEFARTARAWLDEFRPEVLEINEVLTLPLVEEVARQIPVVLNVHNLVWRVAQRMGQHEASWKTRLKGWMNQARLRAFEREVYRRPYRFVTCSEADRQGLLELAPQARVSVVPNGVDTDYFSSSADPGGDSERLLFTGKMEYTPNADAVEFFTAEIMPAIRRLRPAAHLEVVGMAPPVTLLDLAASNPSLTVHGEVPDVRPWYERCAISVVPLRAGSGTRLKILEALSMRQAVVSTRIGAEGLDLVDGEHLLLADDPRDFAEKVLALMHDEGLRRRLGENGRRLVRECYDWRRVAPLLAQAWEEAARGI